MLSTEAAQAHLDELRQVVDTLLARERALIDERMLESGTATELWERDAQIAHHQEGLTRLMDANEGLLFGHLETDHVSEAEGLPESWYIGRMGLTDPVSHEVRLVDWRAPVARPFYTATPLHPDGVRVRTHIETSRWRVQRTSPERLVAGEGEEIADGGLLPTSLLAAMDRSRSGHMNDIVATIQLEQDRIIRSELPGTLLVQGGPGTGKTAVALHRAAFLLYEHRDRLERSGVLLVGPNTAFLDYIGQVLPSLGETSVVLTTLATLLPGVNATRQEDPAVAELKGRIGLTDLLRGALDRAQVPARGALDLTLDTGELVTIPEAELVRMRKRVRQRRRPHNAARPDFERVFTGAIARSLVQARTAQGSPLSFVDGTEQELAADLLLDPVIEGAIEELWPRLTPGDLVSAAYAGPEGGLRATQHFSREDRAALRDAEVLRRISVGSGPEWSEADVPALDEAWELLGEDPRPEAAARARRERAHDAEVAYAREVLDQIGSSDDGTEALGAAVTAEQLADRHRVRDRRTLAERAGQERDWTYGHIIVDEAQELSPMALRALIRRCPLQSFTLVGDIHQASSPSATRWEHVLGDQVRRLRRAELTVNYRTPAEVMAVAEGVLRTIDPNGQAPSSLRSTGREPQLVRVAPAALLDAAIAPALAFLREHEEGTVAVLAPSQRIPEFHAALVSAGASPRSPGSAAESRLWLIDPSGAKGLEFDRVVLVEPGEMVSTDGSGRSGLYVALSRATQDLTVVASATLPEGLVLAAA